MTNKTRLFDNAIYLHRMGNLDAASQAYRSLLQEDPKNAEVWYHLSMAEHQSGRLEPALECVLKAISYISSRHNHFELKGNILHDMVRLDEAAESFRHAIKLKPDWAGAHNNLGIILMDQGKFELATDSFSKAIQFDPGYARAYNNLGSSLRAQGKLKAAAESFRKAIKAKPDYVIAVFNLGSVMKATGDSTEAETCFRKAIQLNQNYRPPYISLGNLLLDQNRGEEAESLLRTAVNLFPKDADCANLLGDALEFESKADLAISQYQLGLQLAPSNLKSEFGFYLTLPQVYQSRQMLQASRERFTRGLQTLKSKIDIYKQDLKNKKIPGTHNNFYLAYQGLNDRELQQEYSGFLRELLTAAAPEFFSPLQLGSVTGRRVRIGFLSYFFYQCTVGKYFSSWIMRLDRTRFEIFVYYTNNQQDELTRSIEGASDHFELMLGSVMEIAQKVRNDQLDILVYPEVGMVSNTLMLSAMRLAPVQCAGWGHPVTTGHTNMDYYFSSSLMEPENAADHYSEKLLLLDGLGTCYPRNILPEPGQREEFQLPEGKHLYLCPQSLFKIHPDNDELLMRILEEDREGVLVLFAGRKKPVTDAFIARLSQAFAARGMDKTGRVKILPMLKHSDFLRVNMLCDVMLDTLHWSGGNTSLDALSCALPIVTSPGELMRGRQSYGMLKAMGITELVAQDQDDYVRIALKLGQNPAYRTEIADRIRAHHDKLFENETPIRQLESYFADFMSGRNPETS